MNFLYHFFDYHPEGEYHYFNLAHILAIIIGIGIIIGLCIYLKNKDHKTIKKILIGMEISALTLEIVYWIWEIIQTGSFHYEDSLPLYYCSLFYMVLPFAIFAKNKSIKQGALAYIGSFNMIAGLMGLIINTNLNVYPVFSFVGVRSLLYHYLMIFTSLLIWTTKYYKPNISHAITFIVPLLVVFTPALLVDLNLNTDYFYLNDGRGTPFNILRNSMPQGAYIVVLYIGIILVTNLIFFIPTIVKYIKEKRSEKTVE